MGKFGHFFVCNCKSCTRKFTMYVHRYRLERNVQIQTVRDRMPILSVVCLPCSCIFSICHVCVAVCITVVAFIPVVCNKAVAVTAHEMLFIKWGTWSKPCMPVFSNNFCGRYWELPCIPSSFSIGTSSTIVGEAGTTTNNQGEPDRVHCSVCTVRIHITHALNHPPKLRH